MDAREMAGTYVYEFWNAAEHAERMAQAALQLVRDGKLGEALELIQATDGRLDCRRNDARRFLVRAMEEENHRERSSR